MTQHLAGCIRVLVAQQAGLLQQACYLSNSNASSAVITANLPHNDVVRYSTSEFMTCSATRSK